MILAVTAMVRDEVDVIDAWVLHHLDQGVDVLLVTDNGSTDGTTDVLQRHADAGRLHLFHDPVHRKQQGTVVTQMARRAATKHGADWVINADADEFLVPVDRSTRLVDAFEMIDVAIQSFTVPVVNLVGPLALDGAGFDRLIWRDERTPAELRRAGLLAHPTPNAVHVASADVVVAQGNHIVSLESLGTPPSEAALEVLHLPWRSWRQIRHKVDITGAGYEASPDLVPSPNHHGMRDYRRLHEGVLLPYAAARHVTDEQADEGSFRRDTWLRDHLASLGAIPGRPDVVFDDGFVEALSRAGLALIARDDRISDLAADAEARERELTAQLEAAHARLASVETELAAQKERRIVKFVDTVGERLPGRRR